MKESPEISVIMTCYNEEKEWVIASIESIINQTFKEFELIIVLDNPNNDELKHILNHYRIKDNRIKVIINNKNEGLVISLNRAICECKGKYIARMDADDISYMDRFENQYVYLENNLDIALVGGTGVIMDENGEVLFHTNKLGSSAKKAKKSLLYRNIFFHPTWMFRRSVLNDLKGYNNIPRTEDLDFLCRLILNGYNIVNLPIDMIKVRIRKNGVTYSNNLHQIRSARIIMNDYKKALLYKQVYNPLSKIENLTIKENDIKKYSKACYLYTKSIADIREKKFISGINKLSYCFFSSKDKRVDLYSTIKIKLINCRIY